MSCSITGVCLSARLLMDRSESFEMNFFAVFGREKIQLDFGLQKVRELVLFVLFKLCVSPSHRVYTLPAVVSLRSVPAWRQWYIGPVVVGNVGDDSVNSYCLHAPETQQLSYVICRPCKAISAAPLGVSLSMRNTHGCCTLLNHFEYNPFPRRLAPSTLKFLATVITSSTEPEIHNVSRRRQRRTELRP